MIIDSHTHIGKLPDSDYSESHQKNLNLILKEAKESGVDKLIIIAGFDDDKFGPATETQLKLTEGIENIYTVAGVSIDYTKEDLEKFEKWLKEKKIIGFKFYTGYQHFYPNDERCKAIYDLCIKYDVPVIFHMGDTLAGTNFKPKIKYTHPLNIDEVAVDFDDLKIIIAHMGNPWLIDCAEVLYKNKNVYADISGLVVGNQLNTPYGEMMKKRIKELINYTESFKLLYGTDWPLCNMKPYIEFAKSLGLDESSTKKLFSENAKKLFKL